MLRLEMIPAALVSVAIFVLIAPPSAHALSCPQLTAEEYVERADVVLVGMVESGEPAEHPGPLNPDEAATARIAVEQYLKGRGPERISIRSIRLGWLGGWPERFIGRWGVFFLEVGDDRHVEQGCPGSRFTEHPDLDEFLDEVIAVTGAGVPPKEGARSVEPTPDAHEGQPQEQGRPLAFIGGLTALAVAGAAGAVYAWRKTR